MPKIKNILPGSPEPLGADGQGRRDQLRRSIRPAPPGWNSSSSTTSPISGRPRSSRSPPRRIARATSGTSSSRGCRTGRSTTSAPTARTTRSVDGTRFNVTKTLLDPYATAVTGDFYWQSGDALGYDNSDPTDPDRHLLPSAVDNVGGAPRCVAYRSDFDWEGDRHPDIPIEESIIYEVNVRGFTRHHSSESDLARDVPRLHREDPLPEGAGDHRRRAPADHGVRPVRRPLPRPDDGRAPGQRLGLQHGRLLRPRVALQLLRQARRAGRRVQDARPRAAQARHRGHPRRRLQPLARGEPLRADGQLQGPGQQHLLHARVGRRSSTTTSPAAATR